MPLPENIIILFYRNASNGVLFLIFLCQSFWQADGEDDFLLRLFFLGLGIESRMAHSGDGVFHTAKKQP